MAAPRVSAPLTLEQLLEAVDHLPPAQRLEFERRLAALRVKNEEVRPEEVDLIRAARVRLPAAEERRLRTLIARSERGKLTEEELVEYQNLAREFQRIDAAREALAELARRRGKPVRVVRAEIGREGGTNDM